MADIHGPLNIEVDLNNYYYTVGGLSLIGEK